MVFHQWRGDSDSHSWQKPWLIRNSFNNQQIFISIPCSKLHTETKTENFKLIIGMLKEMNWKADSSVQLFFDLFRTNHVISGFLHKTQSKTRNCSNTYTHVDTAPVIRGFSFPTKHSLVWTDLNSSPFRPPRCVST